ncbi:hypothetical protein MKX01_004860 [Papaver californicum]|nr:hypothetical protein MKX01_004860 [Papaver californicum]
MVSSMLNGAENLTLIRGLSPNGLGFVGSNFNGRSMPKLDLVSYNRNHPKSRSFVVPKCSISSSTPRPASQPRFIQHKKEAFWFYRFLSIVHNHVINPGHWTEDMRDDALEPADLNDRNLVVIDVGGGTGFTTLGIVKHVDAKNVTILDQSPHQLAKAKEKTPLKDCKIIEGDAEDLSFPTDYANRYVSAGSIDYWPDPQRGIKEAYRVLKIGGKACLIGPCLFLLFTNSSPISSSSMCRYLETRVVASWKSSSLGLFACTVNPSIFKPIIFITSSLVIVISPKGKWKVFVFG